MPPAIQLNAQGIDLSARFKETHAVVGSPATNAETTVASLTIGDDLGVATGVFLLAWVAFTVGTAGDGANLKIHHTNSSGATLAATGLVTATATNLMELNAQGIDAVPVLPGQIYIATLTVHAGAAISTVSAVSLFAFVV